MHPGQAEGRSRREAFLAALREGRSVTGAALAAGVNRTLLYKWRGEITEFAAAWDEAVRTSADLIEDEALRRAMQGVQRPVFYRGEQIGTITTYSDRLLALLLQRRRPVPPPGRARAKANDDTENLAARLVAARQRLARADQESEEARRAKAEAAVATPAANAPVPAAAGIDNAGGATPPIASTPTDTPAPMPAVPSPDDPHRAPAAAQPAPRRRAASAAIHDPPYAWPAGMMDLTSAQALELLVQRPRDPDRARFGPPWGG